MCVVAMLLSSIIGFTIVDSIDVGDFANGVAYGNGYVWACENSSDNIYKIDPNNMQIVSSFSYSGGLDGLGHDGQYLWIGYFPSYIHKVDTLGNMVDSWPSPGTYAYGMAYDGQYLWHADYGLNTIYKLDYDDPTVIHDSFNVPWQPRDLGWHRNHLWAMADGAIIYELDPADMSIINSWPTGRPYSAGLALGGGYLWFGTNNSTGWVYKVAGVVGVEEVVQPEGEPRFGLLRVCPNPFRGSATLSLAVPGEQELRVRIFDSSGRLVKSLFGGEPSLPALRMVWDGKNDAGLYVNSGVYFVRAETASDAVLQKIVFLGR